ncbi:MAG: hypothetical protein HY964_06510 [Ignavibacteriales bacterium]|nr:hypothetical protein [Ignavibacteriales bacterium]
MGKYNILKISKLNELLIKYSPPILLFFSITVVYRFIFHYPYIQDDWLIIGEIKRLGGEVFFSKIFSDIHYLFFRPVGKLYFLGIYNLYNLDSAGFHLISIIIHFLSSLLVARIVIWLTEKPFIGWSAGFLYASAIKIHIDSMMWLVGFYDVGGAFFFFLSLYLFLRRKNILSAIAYLFAVFTKESTVILLPVLFFAGFLFDYLKSKLMRKIFLQLKDIWFHLFIFVLFLLVRIPALTSLPVEEVHPYRLSVTAGILFSNISLSSNWLFETLIPVLDISSSSIISIICLILILALLHIKTDTDKRILMFLEGWLIIGIFPVIFLADHFFRYYLTYSLPPFIMLMLLFLKNIIGLIYPKRSIDKYLFITVTTVVVIISINYIVNIEKLGFNIPTMAGSNNLIRKGVIVKMVQNYLIKNHADLPNGSALLFNWIPTVAFGKEQGPRIWYNDNSIQVYEIQHVGRDNGGIFPITERMESTTDKYLKLDKIIFLAFHGDYIREVSEDEFFKK